MSIYLICLTYNGGLPIFTRCKGEFDNLPFSTVASLNGFHLFFKSLKISLHITYADNWYYLWRDFNKSVTIIVCAKDVKESHAELLAELVFGALSLFVSVDDMYMSDATLLERLKKESKNYLPIIDVALDICINQLLGFSDCLLASENAQTLSRLNEFSNLCGSLFCCLSVGHRIAVATDGWWDLNLVDRQLLLCGSIGLKNEMAIYLPRKSLNMAFRFITLTISHNIVLCVICGTEPSLRILQRIADKIFHTDVPTLKNLERYIPMSFAPQLKMDSHIVAIIFANTTKRKSALCINSQKATGIKCLPADNSLLDHLRQLFIQSIANVSLATDQETAGSIEMFDQYWHSDTHKCYVLADGMHNILCMLCTSSVPTHTMKTIGMDLFTDILQNTTYCW